MSLDFFAAMVGIIILITIIGFALGALYILYKEEVQPRLKGYRWQPDYKRWTKEDRW